MISCIIPIYNYKKLKLNRLFKSLRKQNSLIDVEYLFIENGKKTNLEKYLNNNLNDLNFKYFYCENANVSNARNIGIDKSSGEYLCFIDSDDYVESNWLSNITLNLGYDLIFFDFKFISKRNTLNSYKIDDLNKVNVLKSIIDPFGLRGYLWNKVFKSEIVKNENIYFDKNLNFCEDLDFVVRYVKYCKTFKYIKNSLYNYVHNDASLSNTNFSNKYLGILSVRKELSNINDKECSKYNKLVFCQFYSRALCDVGKKFGSVISKKFGGFFKKCKSELNISNFKMYVYTHPKLYSICYKFWKRFNPEKKYF